MIPRFVFIISKDNELDLWLCKTIPGNLVGAATTAKQAYHNSNRLISSCIRQAAKRNVDWFKNSWDKASEKDKNHWLRLWSLGNPVSQLFSDKTIDVPTHVGVIEIAEILQ